MNGTSQKNHKKYVLLFKECIVLSEGKNATAI